MCRTHECRGGQDVRERRAAMALHRKQFAANTQPAVVLTPLAYVHVATPIWKTLASTNRFITESEFPGMGLLIRQAVFLHNGEITVQTCSRNFPRGDCGADGAVRLILMPAIGEPAVTQIGCEFNEALLNVFSCQVSQAEVPHTRGVDQVAMPSGQVVKRGVAGGMLSLANLL